MAALLRDQPEREELVLGQARIELRAGDVIRRVPGPFNEVGDGSLRPEAVVHLERVALGLDRGLHLPQSIRRLARQPALRGVVAGDRAPHEVMLPGVTDLLDDVG